MAIYCNIKRATANNINTTHHLNILAIFLPSLQFKMMKKKIRNRNEEKQHEWETER